MDTVSGLLAGLEVFTSVIIPFSSLMSDYRKPGLPALARKPFTAVPEDQQLISKENIPHFSCNITNIRGVWH
ncbi:hypothetical protein [Enterobacter cancerogenus]